MSVIPFILLTFLAQAAPLTPDPQARRRRRNWLGPGLEALPAGRRHCALEKFEAAYVRSQPKLMFNIGQANRDLGRPVEQ